MLAQLVVLVAEQVVLKQVELAQLAVESVARQASALEVLGSVLQVKPLAFAES